jgi:uncharacterized membrane protein YvbJ
MSDKEKVGTIKVCPACGDTLGSFQTKCASCGLEISSAQDEESVAAFFQKLDDLTQQEYQENKLREKAGKRKIKQTKPMIICEVIAIATLIVLIIHFIGLTEWIKDLPAMFAETQQNDVSIVDTIQN